MRKRHFAAVAPQVLGGFAEILYGWLGFFQGKRHQRLPLGTEARLPEIIFQAYFIEGYGLNSLRFFSLNLDRFFGSL